MNLSGVILAGGRSRRMGRDKAWLEIGGLPLVSRAADTLRAAGIEEIFISGRAGSDYSALPCPVLFDLEPDCGPLAGIERALAASQAPLTLVLAVDLPQMTAGFLRELAAGCDPLTGVVPILDGELEPLAAVYPRRCQALARECLRNAQYSARRFAEMCRREGTVKTMPVSPAAAACFVNWNTPAHAAGQARSGDRGGGRG